MFLKDRGRKFCTRYHQTGFKKGSKNQPETVCPKPRATVFNIVVFTSVISTKHRTASANYNIPLLCQKGLDDIPVINSSLLTLTYSVYKN